MSVRRKVLLGVLCVPLVSIVATQPSSADVPKGLPWTWPAGSVSVPLPLPIPTAPPIVTAPPTTTTTTTTSTPSFPRGALFLDPARYAKILTAFAPAMGKLPASVDMSADFPPPGEQGMQGSCVAWAVGYGLKSFREHEERGWTYSPDHEMSPSYIFNQLKKGKCGGGLYLSEALDLVAEQGIAPLSMMPYKASECSTQPSAAAREAAQEFRIQSSRRVPLDLVEMKGHLAAGAPILVGMEVDSSFDRVKGKTVYHGATSPIDGGHAMVIVGYDDGKQAFKLFNSWGKSWGDGGYGWVSYPAMLAQAEELYVAKDFTSAPSPKPPVTPVPNPAPTPAPGPVVKSAPKAKLSTPSAGKNVLVGDRYFFGVGVAGSLENAQSHNVELVVRFEKKGKPIASKDAEYSDAHGRLAVKTPKMAVGAQTWSLANVPEIALPQATLRASLGAKGETMDVDTYYDVYVDGFHVGRSATTKLSFTSNP